MSKNSNNKDYKNHRRQAYANSRVADKFMEESYMYNETKKTATELGIDDKPKARLTAFFSFS